jgi:hypothetical protein
VPEGSQESASAVVSARMLARCGRVSVDKMVATRLRAESARQAYDRAMELSYKRRGPFEDAEVTCSMPRDLARQPAC